MAKRIIALMLTFGVLLALCSCSLTNNDNGTTDIAQAPENKFVGTWLNADTADRKVEFEIKDDGTLIYQEKTEGTWEENGKDHITIKLTVDGEERIMDSYFVIVGDGFVARANEENQHYLDDGEGVLELEIMLTENTCIDCIKE